jgi:hypothetical protein
LTEHGSKDATTDQATIHDWLTQWPYTMIGMPTGMITGMFVVDPDAKGDGIQHFADLCEQHGGVPVTMISMTPSRVQHLFFRYPQDRHIRNSAGRLGRGTTSGQRAGTSSLPLRDATTEPLTAGILQVRMLVSLKSPGGHWIGCSPGIRLLSSERGRHRTSANLASNQHLVPNAASLVKSRL